MWETSQPWGYTGGNPPFLTLLGGLASSRRGEKEVPTPCHPSAKSAHLSTLLCTHGGYMAGHSTGWGTQGGGYTYKRVVGGHIEGYTTLLPTLGRHIGLPTTLGRHIWTILASGCGTSARCYSRVGINLSVFNSRVGINLSVINLCITADNPATESSDAQGAHSSAHRREQDLNIKNVETLGYTGARITPGNNPYPRGNSPVMSHNPATESTFAQGPRESEELLSSWLKV